MGRLVDLNPHPSKPAWQKPHRFALIRMNSLLHEGWSHQNLSNPSQLNTRRFGINREKSLTIAALEGLMAALSEC
jgi:hypothetical protein